MLVTAFDTTLNGVLVIDSDFHIMFSNRVLQDLLGYSAEELHGKPLGELVPLDRILSQVLNKPFPVVGNDAAPKQVIFSRKDGGECHVEVALTPEVDASGEKVVIAFVRDISGRIKAEQKQQLALREAERAGRAKSEFLATMSHEMRTPLHGLIAALDLIEDDQVAEDQRSFLATARDCSARALVQVDDVLELTRLGERVEARARFYPEALAADIVHELRPLAEQAGNRLRVVLEGPFESYRCEGMAIAFSRALYNLVGNAIKFTQDGEVTTRLTLRKSRADEMELFVVVADTGVGIAEKDRLRIFENFETAEASEVSEQTGTGLGLAIARLAVEQQGGQLDLTSAQGVGSSFYFTIPVTTAGSGDLAEEHSEKSDDNLQVSGPPAIGDTQPKHILVVDDHEVNLTLIVKMLERLGHTTEMARDGRQALEQAASKYFDVILMDFSMPVMDGPTAAALIRDTEGPCSDTVIIGVTALIEPYLDEKLVRYMDNVLNKPFTLDQLSHALHNSAQRDLISPLERLEDPEIKSYPKPAQVFEDLCDVLGADKAGQLVAVSILDCTKVLAVLKAQEGSLLERAEVIHKAAGAAALLGLHDLSVPLSDMEFLARRGEDPLETKLPALLGARIEVVRGIIDRTG